MQIPSNSREFYCTFRHVFQLIIKHNINMKQSLLLVDDHLFIHANVTHELGDKYDLTKVVDSKGMFFELGRKSFDAILLDLVLQDGHHGLELLTKLRKVQSKIIILTGNYTPEQFRACLRNGVAGFIDKAMDPGSLASMVEAILKGMRITPGHLSIESRDFKNEIPMFSKRQWEVIELCHRVPTPKQVTMARELSLSEARINNILGDINKKLGTHGVLQIVSELKRRGYVAAEQ